MLVVIDITVVGYCRRDDATTRRLSDRRRSVGVLAVVISLGSETEISRLMYYYAATSATKRPNDPITAKAGRSDRFTNADVDDMALSCCFLRAAPRCRSRIT
jgi:hypothetical protein